MSSETIGICKQNPALQPKTAAEWCGQFKLKTGEVERQRGDPSPGTFAHPPPYEKAEERDQEQQKKMNAGTAGGQS